MPKSRPKGSAFEREFAATMRGARRTPLSGASGGGDITIDDTLWSDWSWELKRRKDLPKFVTDALAQASSDIAIGDPRKPAVAMREDHGRILVAFYWDDLRPWVESIYEMGQAGKVREYARQISKVAEELRRLV